MTKSIVEAIAAAKFLASEEQVAALAGVVAVGVEAGTTYLSVLVAHVQAALKSKRKPSTKVATGAVDDVHKRLYEHVLVGVGPAEMERKERDRKANFARSTAADLRHYIKVGGDVRSLEAGEVRKGMLRAYGRVVPTGTRTERVIAKALGSFERTVQRIAKNDAGEARAQIEAAREKLDELMTALTPKPTRARPKRPASTTRAETRAH